MQTKLNLSDTKKTYNGWADYTTWNCALWIQNDYSFYSIAKECETYTEFLQYISGVFVADATPDGADWGEADLTEMQELIEELNPTGSDY